MFSLKTAFAGSILFFSVFVFSLVLPTVLTADGGFVWSWSTYERLREPGQKAIIVFEDGLEDLFLKVQFEGKVSDFGWIIPLPAKPDVRKVTFSCFHMLDLKRYLGKRLYNTPMDIIRYVLLSESLAFDEAGKPGVEVLSESEIGDYEVKVLKADKGESLNSWLKENKYTIPPGGEKVLDSYIKKNWYFVVVKIKTASQTEEKQELLRKGELAPLHFTFKTDKPVYPLHISSLNQGSTHLKLYLYARELYANKFLLPQERDFLPCKQYQLKLKKMEEEEDGYDDLAALILFEEEPFGFYLNDELPPSLRYEIKRPSRGFWYCSRFEKKIPCKEMQEDIIFSSDEKTIKEVVKRNREIEEKLGYTFDMSEPVKKEVLHYSWIWTDNNKYILADWFKRCKTLEEFKGKAMPSFQIPPKLKPCISRKEMDNKIKEIVNMKGKNWNGEDGLFRAEEKLDAIGEKWLNDRKLTKEFADFLKEFKLHKSYRWYCKNKKEEEEFQALLPRYTPRPMSPLDYDSFPQYLKQPSEELFNGASPFKDYSEAEYDENYNIKKKTKKLSAYALKQQKVLKFLVFHSDPASFNLFSEWLKNKNPAVRKTALRIMHNSLSNGLESTIEEDNFGWEGKVRAYICESAFDNRKENCDKVRPLLKDPDPDCQRYAAWILALLGDAQSKAFFLKTAEEAGKTIRQYKGPKGYEETADSQKQLERLAEASIIAMAKFKDPDYKKLIIKLLRDNSDNLINRNFLLSAAAIYFDDPDLKKIYFKDSENFQDIRKLIADELEKNKGTDQK